MPVTEISRIRKPRTQAELLRDARRLAKIKNDQLVRRDKRVAELEMQLEAAEWLQSCVNNQAGEIGRLQDQLMDARQTIQTRDATAKAKQQYLTAVGIFTAVYSSLAIGLAVFLAVWQA